MLYVLSWASAVSLAAWVYLALFRGGFWRVRDESGLPADTPAPPRRVAVVIPARDEADVIGRAVASLARQDYRGDLRVFVVDDHSSDNTAALARRALPSVSVIAGQPLPSGWTGKMWAVAQGLECAMRTDPDYVLLTDADVEHASDSISSLIARAERGGFDLTSYMVRLNNTSSAERALMPAFVFFFFKLYPPAWGRGAAGGCMLVRASALRRIGGVSRIRDRVIDDCALAAEVINGGGRVWLGLSARTCSLRIYSGFGEIANMIARTAFTQLRHSNLLLAGTVLAMSIIYIVPVAAAIAGIWTGALAWLLMALVFTPLLRIYGQSLLWAPWLPLIAGFYTAATGLSALRYWQGRGGAWKGRVQDVRRG